MPLGHAHEPGEERTILAPRSEAGVDAPILDRGEVADLAFALDDHPQRDRLHAPGREPGLDPPPGSGEIL